MNTTVLLYKITNTADFKIYIDSTTISLARRMAVHRADARNMLRTKSLAMHMRVVGIECFKIEKIAEVTFTNKDDLCKLEQAEIDKCPRKLLLNDLKAYVSDSGDRAEYHQLYDAEIRDPEARRQNKREAYARMMADPEKAAKERERNRLRMQRNQCRD
jgi:hypothetical protein